MTTREHFGAWKSPLEGPSLARSQSPAGEVKARAGTVYWTELRPTEGGRYVLVSDAGSGPVTWTPEGYNVRTRAHEYGGGAYSLCGSGVVFSNFSDQRLYRQDGPEADPRPLTPEPPELSSVRFADGVATPDGRFLICVRETHGPEIPDNEIVSVSLDDGSQEVLATGNDFYQSPRLSPDGSRLAYVTWDFPNMPWDSTRIEELALRDGRADGTPRLVAGDGEESVIDPRWSAEGVLHFVGDRTNWWNIYREGDAGPEVLFADDAEFGGPQWLFGLSYYDFLEDGRVVARYSSGGFDHLVVIENGALRPLETPFDLVMPYISCDGTTVAFLAGSAADPLGVRTLDLATETVTSLQASGDVPLQDGYISRPEPITFPTEEGLEAHALYYPPTNADFIGPQEELPPLLVTSHGGPTSKARPVLDLELQFWTSRGFAVVDVDYGGSTGYGREYRNRLRGRWGIVDVDDCINAARHLVARGDVDGDRVAVRGWSAGGFTTLTSLALRDYYAAGASHFGVADLGALARETHKFESRYLDLLVGPWPEAEEVYQARSALFHAEGISCPIILFQGLEDEVVLPEQAETMVAALEKANLPYAYIAYEGEQHGFRKAENIERTAEAELYFYGKIFGFEPADDIEPVDIKNL